MGYKLKTGPSVEPVSSTEAKLHLKIDSDTTDDTLIAALITAARETAENYTGRALINQIWELAINEFPDDDFIELPPSPLSSITSLIYQDADGVNTTASSSTLYEPDLYSVPGRLCLRYGQAWPTARDIQNSITVTYVSGYGSAGSSVPGAIKAAILLIIGHLYENREAVDLNNLEELPMGAKFLLEPYRVIKF